MKMTLSLWSPQPTYTLNYASLRLIYIVDYSSIGPVCVMFDALALHLECLFNNVDTEKS